MQRPSTMRPGQPSTTGLVIEPEASVSRYLVRRTRELIPFVLPGSIDGMGARERRDLLAAGRQFPPPRLFRGTCNGHRCELSVDEYGQTIGRCDCRASRWGRLCSHLLAFSVVAVADYGFRGA
jgi:hypothetical protein